MRSPAAGRVSLGYSTAHQAIDIVNSFDSPIAAPISGKVVFVGNKGSGVTNAGLVVEIQQGNQLHRLCHLNRALVKVNQLVSEGQEVAKMGHSGFTIPSGIGGTHLHWIMFLDGRRVNPRDYVQIPPSGNTVIPSHRYGHLVGRTIQLQPKNGTWTFYKPNTDTVAVKVRNNSDLFYHVRGVSQRPNRIVIFSASGGGLVDCPLATAAGKEYTGEWRVV